MILLKVNDIQKPHTQVHTQTTNEWWALHSKYNDTSETKFARTITNKKTQNQQNLIRNDKNFTNVQEKEAS